MKKLIWIVILIFSSSLRATVAPIVSGESLWWIVKRIGLEIDTIESKIDLLDTSTTDAGCGVRELSAADVVGGTLAISAAGSYCLIEDITGNITVNSSSVSLSLSGHRVIGTIQAISGSYINIRDGFVTPPVPTSSSDPAGIDIASGVSKLFIEGLVVECTDAGAGSGIDGRDGMSIAGDDIQVRNCTTIAGAGGTAAGAGGVGGNGIALTANATEVVLAHCVVIGGDGGDSSGAAPGAGGHGIAIEGADDVSIESCTIFRSGDGGEDFSAAFTGGAGGHGIACITSAANNVFIKDCTIQKSGIGGDGGIGGNGGVGLFIDSVSNTKIMVSNCTISDMGVGGTGLATAGGNGGNGISIGSSNTDVSVRNCTISNSGAGGSGPPAGTAGKAIDDDVPVGAGSSKVYANMAHDIANSIRYDLQASGVENGFDISNPPTSTAVNIYANVFM